MSVTMKVLENGPVVVTGECQVTDASGKPLTPKGNPFHLCRCGASANKPFCDGQHKKIEFKG